MGSFEREDPPFASEGRGTPKTKCLCRARPGPPALVIAGKDSPGRRIIGEVKLMITRLQVRNFKSLRAIDLSLGPLNVLVGPNMSGKSNVLDVFFFLQQLIFPQPGVQGISYAMAQRGGVNEVRWKGGDDALIAVALEGLDEIGQGTRYRYSLELVVGTGDFVNLQSESLKVFRSGTETDLIVPQQGGFVQLKNADGKDAGNVGSTGVSALQYAPPNWDGYKFYEWVRQWRYYHLIPPVMKQPSSMSAGQVLMANGDNLSAWLMWLQTRSPESFGRVNEVLRDLFPDILEVKTLPTADGKVHLGTVEKGLKRPTTVWQASDGFLTLTALLSLIYVPPELSGTLFCIEEPENYLHPRLLETLAALLRQVRQEVLDRQGSLSQIILTTQSPYLVDRLSLEEIIWIEKKNGETKVFHPADKQSLRRLIEDKELGLGDLMLTGALGDEK
jgi:predicted ATPase